MQRPQDKAVMERFRAFCSKNGAPMGEMYYWIGFYLDGEDQNGKQEKP